jgi:hypothetical protein
MDRTPTPTTKQDPLETPNSADSGDTAKAARQLFTGAAPAKKPPSRPVPLTEKVSPAKQASRTEDSDVTAQICDLTATVSALAQQNSLLSQQMAHLMSLMAQQLPTSNDVADTQGGAPANDVAEIQGRANSTSNDAANIQGRAPANDVTDIQSDATYHTALASQPSRAAAVHRPSSVMLTAHIIKNTDPQMYRDCQDLKPKPSNPAIALSAFRKIKPQVIKAIQDIKQPGIQADIALSTFISEARAVLNSPADHTLAALLTEALTTGSKTVDTTTQNLLRLAVKCGSPEEIYLQAQLIRQTGRYNRSKAALADVTQDPAYNNFSPETNQGKHLWAAILDLLLAYWQRSKSGIADQLALETEYRGMTCTNPDEISSHLTAEAELYTKLTSAHIIYSDQQRIRAILASCSKQINAEYQSFKKRKHQDNLWNPLRDTDVNLFAQDLETVTDAMDPAEHDQPPHHTKTPRKQQDTPRDRPGLDDRPCWDHQHLADGCSRGEHCPWEHRGEAAAKKLKYQTEDGTCRAFLTDTCDRGDICKFKHPAKSDADDASAKVHHLDGAPKRECRDHKNGRCMRGDQCPYLHPEPPEPAAMHTRLNESSDDSSDDEDLYESY